MLIPHKNGVKTQNVVKYNTMLNKDKNICVCVYWNEVHDPDKSCQDD
jgi:hypothetical protein